MGPAWTALEQRRHAEVWARSQRALPAPCSRLRFEELVRQWVGRFAGPMDVDPVDRSGCAGGSGSWVVDLRKLLCQWESLTTVQIAVPGVTEAVSPTLLWRGWTARAASA